MKPTGTFTVKCSKCETQYSYPAAEADFESVSGSERQMGQENGYQWQETFECDECGNEIEIEYNVYEYPTGVLNMEDVKVEGASVESEFNFEFFEHDDDDDYDGRDENEEDYEAPEHL